MKKSNDLLSLAVGLMLSVVLITGFMNPVFASGEEQEDGWSQDYSAFSLVLGKYTQIGAYYDLWQEHYGEINGSGCGTYGQPHTRFEQRNFSDTIYDEDYPLNIRTKRFEGDITYNDWVKFIKTCTYSGNNQTSGICTKTLEIGPPGAQ